MISLTETCRVPEHQYRAWLIDLDGTLYRPLPVKLLMAGELIVAGRKDWRVVRHFRRTHEKLRTSQRVSDTSPDLASILSETETNLFETQLAITATETAQDPERVRKSVMKWMFERPARWLRLFRRRSLVEEICVYRRYGGCTALVSDYPAQSKLNALGIRDLFDCIIANGETQPPTRLKPAADAYLRAAEQLGASADECLVIGDRKDADGQAATTAGMAFRLV